MEGFLYVLIGGDTFLVSGGLILQSLFCLLSY